MHTHMNIWQVLLVPLKWHSTCSNALSILVKQPFNQQTVKAAAAATPTSHHLFGGKNATLNCQFCHIGSFVSNQFRCKCTCTWRLNEWGKAAADATWRMSNAPNQPASQPASQSVSEAVSQSVRQSVQGRAELNHIDDDNANRHDDGDGKVDEIEDRGWGWERGWGCGRGWACECGWAGYKGRQHASSSLTTAATTFYSGLSRSVLRVKIIRA